MKPSIFACVLALGAMSGSGAAMAAGCPSEAQVKAALTKYINKDYWTPSQRDIWKIKTVSPLSFGPIRFGKIIAKQVEYGRAAEPVCPVRVEYSFSTVSQAGARKDTKMGENNTHLFYQDGFGDWIFKTG